MPNGNEWASYFAEVEQFGGREDPWVAYARYLKKRAKLKEKPKLEEEPKKKFGWGDVTKLPSMYVTQLIEELRTPPYPWQVGKYVEKQKEETARFLGLPPKEERAEFYEKEKQKPIQLVSWEKALKDFRGIPEVTQEVYTGALEEYEAAELPEWQTGRDYPEWLGGEEITIGVKEGMELTTDIALFSLIPSSAMPTKVFSWLGKYAAKGGLRAILPQTGQVIIAPFAGAEWLVTKTASYPLKGFAYLINKGLRGLGWGELAITSSVDKKYARQALKGLEKLKAGQKLTKTETDALARTLAKMEAAVPPSILTKAQWTKMPRPLRRAAAKAWGMSEKVGNSSWERLTAEQRRLFAAGVIDAPIKEVAIGATDLAADKMLARMPALKNELLGRTAEVHATRVRSNAILGKFYKAKTPKALARTAEEIIAGTKKALVGKVPTKPVPGSIGAELTAEEMRLLIMRVTTSPKIPAHLNIQRADAILALQDMLFMNRLPNPSQIAILEKVFGSEFTKGISRALPLKTKLWQFSLDAANVPKTAMAAWDASATYRQGGILFWGHLSESVRAIPYQFKAFFNAGGVSRRGWGRMTLAEKIAATQDVGLTKEVAGKAWDYKSLMSREAWRKLSPTTKLNLVLTEGERTSLQERFFSTVDTAIRSHRLAGYQKNVNLYLADIRGMAPQLFQREESFVSHWARHLPLVRRSERAFVTYLNKVRADVFNSTITSWEKSGIDVWGVMTKKAWTAMSPEKKASVVRTAGFGKKTAMKAWETLTAKEKKYLSGIEMGKSLANYINLATGRGNIGNLKDFAVGLNAMMFSPRLQLSRLQLPFCLTSGSPAVRALAAKDMALFFGVNMAVLTLLDQTGVATVEKNPLSTDFGKVRIGNTRIEFWAGYQPYIRFIAQFLMGKRKTTTGRLQTVNRLELITRFLMTKRSPALGMFMDILGGRTFLGKEISYELDKIFEETDTYEGIGAALLENFVPLFVQDMFDAIEEEGLIAGIALAQPGMWGAGVQSYDSSQQVVGEVFYAASQYQEMQRKLREFVEEGDRAGFYKYAGEHPDAQWEDVNSNTLRSLNKVTRRLTELKKERAKVEEQKDMPKEERQGEIEALNREMIQLAVETMLVLDQLEIQTKSKATGVWGMPKTPAQRRQ